MHLFLGMKDFPDIAGKWVHEDEDSDAEFIIDTLPDGPVVTARCISDGEIMEVRGLRWENRALCFETIVPSSGYQARHKMTFFERDTCDHELTIFERWKREPRQEF